MSDGIIYLTDDTSDGAPYVVLERWVSGGLRLMAADVPGGDQARYVAGAAVAIRALGGDWRKLDGMNEVIPDKEERPEWPTGLIDAYDHTRPLARRMAVVRRLPLSVIQKIVAEVLLMFGAPGN